MKKWFLHILLLAGLFGTLTTSCSQEDVLEEVSDIRSEKLQVYFTLNLGEEEMQSRTTWEGYDKDDANSEGEEGNNLENKVEDIQVLLFSNDDNTFLGEVSITAFYPTDGDSHLYKFYGELPTLPTGKSIMDATKYLNCKIMVLANCSVDPSDITGTTDISTLLEGATFNFNGKPSQIPMWGVLKVVPNDGVLMHEDGFPNPLPDIYLLRAMAKVEVIMQAEDHEITSIAIENYNNTGYCVPTGYATATDTRKLVRNNVFRATTNNNTGESSFIANVSNVTINENGTDKTYKCYTIHVPEYKNMEGTTAVTNPSSIVIKLDNKDKEYRINYGTNGKNTEWNIVRNHIYRYNITEVKDGVNLELTCQVQPWNLEEQVIDYKSEPSAAEGGKIKWTTSNPDANNKVTLTSELKAVCEFTLDSPLGYRWLATLVPVGDGASAANTPFGFIVDGEDVGLDTSGIIDGNKVTLTIQSDAVDGVDEDKEVRLQIIVIKGDGTSVILDKDIIGGPYTIIHTK